MESPGNEGKRDPGSWLGRWDNSFPTRRNGLATCMELLLIFPVHNRIARTTGRNKNRRSSRPKMIRPTSSEPPQLKQPTADFFSLRMAFVMQLVTQWLSNWQSTLFAQPSICDPPYVGE